MDRDRLSGSAKPQRQLLATAFHCGSPSGRFARPRSGNSAVPPKFVSVHGTFPFGRPNSVRPPRVPSGPTRVLVVGVYPSAFHVRWWRPDAVESRPTISSLAVDVEPVVFWDGQEPSLKELLDDWVKSVGFTQRWGRAAPGHNGPSGQRLRVDYLEPLGLDETNTAYTDLIPWFFVKAGAGSQGRAISERFEPWAVAHEAPTSTLPERPSPKRPVDLVNSSGRSKKLRTEITMIRPEVVLTLGQEALDGLTAIADHIDLAQTHLTPDDAYGRPGTATIDDTQFTVIAVAHPGLLRQTTRGDWKSAHARWANGLT